MNYWRVESASPELKVADVDYNVSEIISMAKAAEEKGVEILLFPELATTGYSAGDLFGQSLLIDQSTAALATLAEELPRDMLVVVGAPLFIEAGLYNCAICYYGGEIVNVQVKTHLPNYKEFYEKRWFKSSMDLKAEFVTLMGEDVPIDCLIRLEAENKSVTVGIEICEDLFVAIPPSSYMALEGAEILLNLSASNETVEKDKYREQTVSNQSARCLAAYVYSSAGVNESTQDIVFCGACMIYENGRQLAKGDMYELGSTSVMADIDVDNLRHERSTVMSFTGIQNEQIYDTVILDFEGPCDKTLGDEGYELLRYVDPHPFVPSDTEKLHERCLDITAIQTMGLVKRLKHINCKDVVIGVSGGLDSTLAILVCCRAFDILGLDRKGIHGITMPGLGTSKQTKTLADSLMEVLGVSSTTINISEASAQHMEDIGHEKDNYNVVFENAQARERTQVLMDYSNKVGGIVIGTGDLSELALGWCTYNGDHMSMYGVNCSVPKTLVRYLVSGYGEILGGDAKAVLDEIVSIPISPELLPTDVSGGIAQKTEDIIGPYELHDFFLYHMIRFGEEPKKIYNLCKIAFPGYDDETIKKWMTMFYRRFFNHQFKRSCLPDGPKVGSISLSPRGDWRMPSDACGALWLKEIEKL